MKRATTSLLVAALVLTACGSVRDSRFNPFNWFSRGTAEPVEAQADVNPLIPRRRAVSFFANREEVAYAGIPISDVTELVIERRPGGAIIRATGVAARQMPFDVRLVPVPEETDATTLTYAMRTLQTGRPGGAVTPRTVTAALTLTDQDLFGIRAIRVTSANTVRTARR